MSYAILWGVIGGAVISLLLIYPLCFHLPIILIPNWHKPFCEVSVLFVLISLLTLVVIGMLTARYGNAQSGLQRITYGMLGGLVSSTIGYGILVGPASGVWGLFRAFPNGIYRAPDNAAYLAMITNAVISIGFWSAVTQWGYIGMGVLLGGAGGLLTKSRRSSTDELSIAQQVVALSAVGIPAASANCIQVIYTLSLLYEQVRKAASVDQFSLPIWISTNAPMVSAFVWLLGWQIVTWRAFIHIRKQTTICRISWLLSGVFGILCPLVQVFAVLFAHHRYLSFSLLSLLIGFLSGYNVWKMKALPKKFEYPSPKSVFAYIAQAGLIISLTSIWGNVNLSLNYVMLVIPLIIPLQASSAETASTAIPLSLLIKMIKENYLASAQAIAGGIINMVWGAFVIAVIYHNAVKYIKTFGYVRKMALQESEERGQ